MTELRIKFNAISDFKAVNTLKEAKNITPPKNSSNKAKLKNPGRLATTSFFDDWFRSVKVVPDVKIARIRIEIDIMAAKLPRFVRPRSLV